MTRCLSLSWDVYQADVKAIVDQPVGGDQPGEIVSQYQNMACHMEGATGRVKKDLNQMPAAMLRR